MTDEVGNGDSADVKKSIIELQRERQILTDRLADIGVTNDELRHQLDAQRAQTAEVEAQNGLLDDRVEHLKTEWTALADAVRIAEQQMNESRDCVQQLAQQLVHKRIDQSIKIDQMVSEMRELAKQVVCLTASHISRNKSTELRQKVAEIDGQIADKQLLRSQLLEELQKLKSESTGAQSGGTGECVQYVKENEANNKWKDWPVSQIRIALDIFIHENQVLAEEMEYLQKNPLNDK